jgi:guanidinopropionase
MVSLPILRALGKGEPVGLIQFYSHTDLFDSYFGSNTFTHCTPFRRAVKEGLMNPARFVQVGIRGTAYNTEDIDWGLEQGIRIIRIKELFERGIPHVMVEVRKIVGTQPTYCTYDIDFVDPTFVPGTGTPEAGGANGFQAQQVIRELDGVNLIGRIWSRALRPSTPLAARLGWALR